MVTSLREPLGQLIGIVDLDIDALLAQADNPREAKDVLMDTLPPLVDTYSSAAGALAADWYDQVRIEKDVPGHFQAIIPDTGDKGTEALIGYALQSLHKDDGPDWDAAAALLHGGADRRIADEARQTVMASTRADKQAQGWQRETSGDACGFCEMLASRGTVYSEATVDFSAHDNCQCIAVPAFKGKPRPVKPYTPSTRDLSPEYKARTREYIKRKFG